MALPFWRRGPTSAPELDATLDMPFDWRSGEADIAAALAAGDGAALAVAMRVLRRRLMLHTMVRDLCSRADLAEVCTNMTRLAEITVCAAASLHQRALAAEHGLPRDAQGEEQALVVIGMGKLGGGELNVSSDVDLVFVYPEDGETDGNRALANREFFDRLGRRVIGALNDITPDGYVFRVDMRLRPYGESGPLTVPYSALEQYLITQGRAWERYAWLKARALSGTRHDEARRADHAVRFPQVPRFRRVRGPARCPPADPRAGQAQGLRAEHQAGARRHP